MSDILYDHKEIHFTTVGELNDQPPLLMLNGIMMSAASWKVLAKRLSVKRQVILVDFVDQGESYKAEGEQYNHQLQVNIVLDLIRKLNHKTYDLFGISYGGQVALQVALEVPERIRKLAVFNAAAYTTPWLRDIGRAWVKCAQQYDPESFYLVTIPYIYSNRFYTNEIQWMENRKQLLMQIFSKEFLDAMIRLIHSSEDYDVRERLSDIHCPTLIVGCDSDYLTPPNETKALSDGIEGSIYMELSECGHASMYEKPGEFLMLLDGFLCMDTKLKIVT